jgi:two-component SAPR family response regulator
MFYLGSEGGQRMKILMIESNDLITQQLSEYLNQLGQQDLSVNKDISSLDLDEAHHYDVIFIDYSVRHEDPFELAYRLKQANPDTYIVFLTRFKNNEAEVFENYDIEYILKPINFYRLKNVIEKAKRYKYKPIERFVGDVSVKMFGNMEVKMNCRNVRFMRRRHKEILAYLILNDFSSTIEEMAQAIMNDREEIYAA